MLNPSTKFTTKTCHNMWTFVSASSILSINWRYVMETRPLETLTLHSVQILLVGIIILFHSNVYHLELPSFLYFWNQTENGAIEWRLWYEPDEVHDSMPHEQCTQFSQEKHWEFSYYSVFWLLTISIKGQSSTMLVLWFFQWRYKLRSSKIKVSVNAIMYIVDHRIRSDITWALSFGGHWM